MTTDSLCPICEETTPRKSIADWDAIGCERCGTIYKPDLGTTEELYDFYRHEYYDRRNWDLQRVQNRSVRFCTIIGQFIHRPIEKHLDIGSANGLLLDAVRLIWENESYGVELCERARADCHPDIISWETIDQAHGRFDLITLSHVLEHLPEPMDMLRHIHRLLRKRDGHLVLEVPNFCGEPTALPPTEASSHVLGFSQYSLQFALEKAGFFVREIQTALPLDAPWGHRTASYLTAICTAKPMSKIVNAVQRSYVQLDVVLNKMGVCPMDLATQTRADDKPEKDDDLASAVDEWLKTV